MMNSKWRQLFEQRILYRGENYAKHGAVKDFKMADDFIKATVMGTQLYDVTIDLKQGMPIHMSCTCPYAAKGHTCKHMAAVLIKAETAVSEHEKDTLQVQTREVSKDTLPIRYCPNCGKQLNESEFHYCPYCGFDLPAYERGAYKKCPHCGELVKNNSDGTCPTCCPICGYSFVEKKRAATVTHEEPKIEQESAVTPEPPVAPVYNPPVVEKALLKLSECDKRDRKYGIVLWAYIVLLALFLLFLLMVDSGSMPTALFECGISLIVGLIGYKILHHSAKEGLASRSFVGFWIAAIFLFPPFMYGVYSQSQTYWNRSQAYPRAVACAKRGEWGQGAELLSPYSLHDKHFQALYGFCRTRDYVENGKGQPDAFTVADLPADLQGIGKETEQKMQLIDKYKNAQNIYALNIEKEHIGKLQVEFEHS